LKEKKLVFLNRDLPVLGMYIISYSLTNESPAQKWNKKTKTCTSQFLGRFVGESANHYTMGSEGFKLKLIKQIEISKSETVGAYNRAAHCYLLF